MKKIIRILVPSVFFLAISGCDQDYTPRPKGYFQIDFPQKQFVSSKTVCPFVFDQPVYSVLMADSTHHAEPCWLNLDFVPFNATLHLTYKEVQKDQDFRTLEKDSRNLALKHTVKAQDMFESEIFDPNRNISGVLYEFTGDAATPLQFYLTDSSKHYLRGVLYFNHRTNADSVAPVYQYLKADVLHLVGSLRWNHHQP